MIKSKEPSQQMNGLARAAEDPQALVEAGLGSSQLPGVRGSQTRSVGTLWSIKQPAL